MGNSGTVRIGNRKSGNKGNREFWLPNWAHIQRDIEVIYRLKAEGWTVLRFGVTMSSKYNLLCRKVKEIIQTRWIDLQNKIKEDGQDERLKEKQHNTAFWKQRYFSDYFETQIYLLSTCSQVSGLPHRDAELGREYVFSSEWDEKPNWRTKPISEKCRLAILLWRNQTIHSEAIWCAVWVYLIKIKILEIWGFLIIFWIIK